LSESDFSIVATCEAAILMASSTTNLLIYSNPSI
jgi:hypothetical protein